MKYFHATARITWILLACVVHLNIGACAETGRPGGELSSAFIGPMVGTWDVQQRMWPGSGTKAINLPPALARRRLIGGDFLEEVMELAPGSKNEPFSRIAYFNYNAVNRQYEYFSIDTRAPQMMLEKSHEIGLQNKGQGSITAYGSAPFTAPRWGNVKNAAFRYRLAIGGVQKDRQVVRLYLTPVSGHSRSEFLAFEYVYTRRH